jgi:hypothetical protein
MKQATTDTQLSSAAVSCHVKNTARSVLIFYSGFDSNSQVLEPAKQQESTNDELHSPCFNFGIRPGECHQSAQPARHIDERLTSGTSPAGI